MTAHGQQNNKIQITELKIVKMPIDGRNFVFIAF